MKNSLEKNLLNSEVFSTQKEQLAFKEMLLSISNIRAVLLSRETILESQIDRFLKKKLNNWDIFNLYLAEDLKYWELLEIIDEISLKLDIQEYIWLDELISKTKIFLLTILWKYWQEKWQETIEQLKSNYQITTQTIKKFENHNIKNTKEIRHFLKLILWEKNSKTLKNLWDKWDTNNIWKHLCNILWEEFEMLFFRNFIDKIGSSMKTITQKEQLEFKKNKKIWDDFIARKSTKFLDEEEQLLRDKIWIEKLKTHLKKLRENDDIFQIEQAELEATNKIISIISEYSYKLNNKQYWYKPNEMINNKEMYCVWYSLLWHSFLSELAIKHKWLNIPKHSALEVKIWEKNYLFDATNYSKIYEINYWDNVWLYRETTFDIENNKKTILSSWWKVENVLFGQIYHNLWVILQKKKQYEKAMIFFDKSIKFNPNESWVHDSRNSLLKKLWKNHEI